jgi:probable phosphoglycerate mutase
MTASRTDRRKPATLLLIRHGETAWNAETRIQGQLDVPLSRTGFWQAGRLAERLADEPIDAIVASDFSRAWMTAQPLAQQRRLEPVPDARLRERHFGVFQGLTLDEIAHEYPAEFAAWRDRDPDWAMPGGESATSFKARVLEALEQIADCHAGRTVAVVAHGGVLDVAYRHARCLAWDAPREHNMVNAALNRVTARAHPLAIEIVAWGDVAHLADARDEIAGA